MPPAHPRARSGACADLPTWPHDVAVLLDPPARRAQQHVKPTPISVGAVTVLASMLLFVLAALAEIGGAWLVWQGVREHRGLLFVGAGVVALGLYGFVATLQPDAEFGRILAAYGGVFVAGSLAWGMVVDGFEPDRYDVGGALLCLLGVAVIIYAPRADALGG